MNDTNERREIIWSRVVLAVLTVVCLSVAGLIYYPTGNGNQTTTDKPTVNEQALEKDPMDIFQQVNENNVGDGYQSPMVLAMVPSGDGYKSKVLNFSLAMMRSGGWQPTTVQAGDRMILFALGQSMNQINQGHLKLRPMTFGNVGGNTNPMMMAMLMSSNDMSGMWQMMMFSNQNAMNMTTIQMMQNDGKLPISDQGYAMISVPNIPGLWQGELVTPQGNQSFFFEVEGSGTSGGSGGVEVDFKTKPVTDQLEKGKSSTIEATVDGEEPDTGRIRTYNGVNWSSWQNGSMTSVVPKKDSVNVEFEYNGETYSNTLYTEGYSQGRGSEGGTNYLAVLGVLLAMGIILLVAYDRGMLDNITKSSRGSNEEDIWEG